MFHCVGLTCIDNVVGEVLLKQCEESSRQIQPKNYFCQAIVSRIKNGLSCLYLAQF